MNIPRIHFLAMAAGVIALLPSYGADPTNVRVQNVLKKLVTSNNSEVIGLGSWISGKKYNDPLTGGASDHDMRLLLPQGTPPQNALEQWKVTRSKLTEMIKAEFGKDADRVLSTINLYPPTQLMQGVEDGTDAAGRLISYGTVPNLGYSGAVDASMEQSMAKRLTEGLYGPGASAFTQNYEEDAGRLFYTYDGKAMTGMTDLIHETEGVATYSASGMGNTSLQWVEHAEEAMQNGNGKSLAKYLERLQRDILKGRDLARCTIDEAYLKELKAAAATLRDDPAAAGKFSGRLSELLRRAQIDAVLLNKFDDAGEAQQALLKAAMTSLEESKGLGATLLDAMQKMPAKELVDGMIVTWSTWEASTALGEGKTGTAVAAIGQALLPLGPALAAQLTNQIMEAARDAGFSLMANSQDASDLMAGIFTAGGRADAEAKGYTLDQLVAEFSTDEQLRAFVTARAQQAADRGWGGTATRSADAGVADAIYQRCYPRIHSAWRARRDALMTEFRNLGKQLAMSGIVAGYEPAPAMITAAQPQVKVSVSAQVSDADRKKKIERMKTIAHALLGKRSPGFTVSMDNFWLGPGDKKEMLAEARSFTFSKAGTYPVALRCLVSSDGGGLAASDPLVTRIQRKARVDVVVTTAAGAQTVTAGKGTWVLQKVEQALQNAGPQISEGKGGIDYRIEYASAANAFQWHMHAKGWTSGDERVGDSDVTLAISHSALPQRITSGDSFKLSATYAFTVSGGAAGFISQITERSEGGSNILLYSSLPTGREFRMDLGRGNLAYVAVVGLWTLDHKYVPPYQALGKFNYRIEDAGNAWPTVPTGKPGQLWLIRIETQGTFLDGRSPPPALVETYTYLFQP